MIKLNLYCYICVYACACLLARSGDSDRASGWFTKKWRASCSTATYQFPWLNPPHVKRDIGPIYIGKANEWICVYVHCHSCKIQSMKPYDWWEWCNVGCIGEEPLTMFILGMIVSRTDCRHHTYKWTMSLWALDKVIKALICDLSSKGKYSMTRWSKFG